MVFSDDNQRLITRAITGNPKKLSPFSVSVWDAQKTNNSILYTLEEPQSYDAILSRNGDIAVFLILSDHRELPDYKYKVIQVSTKQALAEFLGRDRENPVAVSNDGRKLITHMGSRFFLWLIPSGEIISETEFKRERPYSQFDVALSPDSQFVIFNGKEAEKTWIWDVNFKGDAALSELPVHKSAQKTFEFSPDGKLLGVFSVGTVEIWDWATQTPLRTAFFKPRPMNGDLINGSRIVAVNSYNKIHLLDVETGKKVKIANGGTSVALSRDLKKLVVSSDGSLTMFSLLAEGLDLNQVLLIKLLDRFHYSKVLGRPYLMERFADYTPSFKETAFSYFQGYMGQEF